MPFARAHKQNKHHNNITIEQHPPVKCPGPPGRAFHPPVMAMWGGVYARGEAPEDQPATPPGQPPVPPPWPPSPVTPTDVLTVDPRRQFAGQRSLVWPRQPGDPAPLFPHDLLSGHGNAVQDMQDNFQEAMRMMVQTELHLEAAMGRNVGNRLSAHPEALRDTVGHMRDTFKVPYSLYEISLRFVCLYDQLVAT